MLKKIKHQIRHGTKDLQDLSKLSKEEIIKVLDNDLVKLPKETLIKLSKDKVPNISLHHISKASKFEHYLFDPAIIKVPIVVGIILILRTFFTYFFPKNLMFVHLTTFLMLGLSVYLTFFIIHLIRHSIKSLLNAKNVATLFISYVLFVFCIILLFSSAYSEVEKMGKGYITYGKCSDGFDKKSINQDQEKSDSFFYFSAITYFTVGYGDICPMGWAKIIAVINAFLGTFINTVVMVIIISLYVKRKGFD